MMMVMAMVVMAMMMRMKAPPPQAGVDRLSIMDGNCPLCPAKKRRAKQRREGSCFEGTGRGKKESRTLFFTESATGDHLNQQE